MKKILNFIVFLIFFVVNITFAQRNNGPLHSINEESSHYISFDKTLITSNLADTFPLPELGINTWKSYEGGLYSNGLNIRPKTHQVLGIQQAHSIIPLDQFGNRDDANGKIVLLSIGMSNATQEFSLFKTIADTFKLKNPKLTIVDGAQGGQTASVIKNPAAQFWTVVNQRLTQVSLNPLQVQTVWLKEANANPNAAFPKHALDLKEDLKAIVQLLKIKFPNLKLLYLSSRIYGGYASTTLNPEPYAYESGFAVKWLIEDQINGDSSLNFLGSASRSPWLSWGPYLWAKGITPRNDGLVWFPSDFTSDGTHPSNSGRLKVANLLLDFFKTDSTSIPWFLKTAINTTTEEPYVSDIHQTFQLDQNIPNPFSNSSIIKWRSTITGHTTLTIYNVYGHEMYKILDENQCTGNHEIRVARTQMIPGIYFYKLQINNTFQIKKMVML